MSKLDELIAELCPDGVEYKEIDEVFELKNGYTPSKENNEFWENGTIPWFRMEDIRKNGHILSDSIQHITPKAVKGNLVPANSIIIATSATIGVHALITVDALANQRFTFLTRKASYVEKLDIKYFFYYCDLLDEWCTQNTTLGNFNSVDINKLRKHKFPVPPLPVQQEIVRILDNFTELKTQLTTELKAEIEARKKQYEYYRDWLLSQEELNKLCPDGVEYKKIKQVYKRLKGTPITAGKMKEIDNPNGEIKIFAGGKTVINAMEKDIPNANITRVPAVLVQSRGVIDAVYYDKPFTFKNEMWAYTADNTIAVKYLYYVLKNNLSYFRKAASGMGSLPQISLPVTEEFVIPVPPLPVQQEIVRILDNFTESTAELRVELETELEARQKQYEYYRDKLLSFKEATV